MFKNRGLFGGLWRPKNLHSLEHLKYLYSVLYKNQTVTESNRSLLVETLRSIAEILIWGDQNDSTVFDFFLERNMLSFFLKIMNQKCGSYVCVQLLQTLNILFENIRNETSIYYLLSNNHVNSIIVHKFDFSDEEVMAYYISFLKTLSFRLNKHTIHFFYNEHTNDFPLYTEAIKFFNHSESMVRIAVRTLTLNVYRVDEESMLNFVIDKTAVPYFANLVWFIGNHILEIDACVRNDADHRSLNRLKDLVAEHLDHLHYLNDILNLEIANLNEVLTDHLLNRLFIPLYIFSLVRKPNTNSMEDMKPHVSRITALFLLCQVFQIIKHPTLVKVLAWIIFSADAEIFTETGASKLAALCDQVSEGQSTEMSRSRRRGCVPSFIAPAVPLEKSLQERIQQPQHPSTEKKSHSKKSKQQRRSAEKEMAAKEIVVEEEEPSPVVVEIHRKRSKDQSVDGVAPSNSATINPVLTGSAYPTNPADLSITDEEKELLRMASSQQSAAESTASSSSSNNDIEIEEEEFSLAGRPFLKSILLSMDPSETDYLVLFSLCLLYTIHQSDSLEKAKGTPGCNLGVKSNVSYNKIVVKKLLRILSDACHYGSNIRLVTLDVAIQLIRQLVVINKEISDDQFAHIEDIKEESMLVLRNFYSSDEMFLDIFEDEYREASKPYLTRMEFVLSDASLLLPPTPTPLTGIEFLKRLPCGDVERARHSIRTFFRMRQLSLEVQNKPETHLPLSNPDQCIQIQQVLDLNNSDLLSVTVTTNGPSGKDVSAVPVKQRRFLVVDVYQIVLVEPDATRLGWGIATFVGFLQDLDVVTDKDDSRCLHVTIHSPGGSSGHGEADRSSGGRARNVAPLLSATFTFDDHIRCMAAKQRLTKGRIKARQRKMHQIERLLEIPVSHDPNCPSPPMTSAVNLQMLRKEVAVQRRMRSGHRDQQGGAGVLHFGGIMLPPLSAAASSTTTTRSASGYRPMFTASGKVPGSAALLKSSESRSSNPKGERQSSATPEIMSDDNSDEISLGASDGNGHRRHPSLRTHQRQMAVSKLSGSQDRNIPASPGRRNQDEASSSGTFGSPMAASFLRRTLSSTTKLQAMDSQQIPLEDYGSKPKSNEGREESL